MMQDNVTPPSYYKTDYWKRYSKVYDFLTRLLFTPFGGEERFRRKFVDEANIQPGDNIIDMCCGTGATTRLVAGKLKDGQVTGVDLSPDMMARAKEKVTGLPAVFQQASGDNLPFPEGTFDKAFVSYGLHEMPTPIRHEAIKQIYKVLKPGGVFNVLDYNLPQGIGGLGIRVFIRVFEGLPAYQMMQPGVLSGELKDGGFEILNRRQRLLGMFQIIQARKPL
ncbi:MAG: methyltransferase domain-containing protein [Dehalococcoides mccartyi]|jgi:Methylase involved in ubiquinone/menaquinone biosynthesis|uniref:SAM-dependent methyltransferase n=2 Tax=root TaxID=1 RepID=A0AB33HRW3_9CHLR|nr:MULTISPECIES: methyltransferase domain-containing protein [Dehalococcoides]AQU03722.1 SAM-dependent methyltransferase [Dehalococcoides mccartyi]AQU05023.1 SAM-dependent methyltransferase [Dehalococcoides mccartyi]MEA4878777.1 methyltransferase domain-containing protein [Dehalococcoides mccartyi]POZ59365.1 methyltransferase, UbiE-COQ5 family [Dehalococcoides mccartyi]BAZ98028.1 SAM-dependent methyltransferase [Dehalococcoides mccartyi]